MNIYRFVRQLSPGSTDRQSGDTGLYTAIKWSVEISVYLLEVD